MFKQESIVSNKKVLDTLKKLFRYPKTIPIVLTAKEGTVIPENSALN